VRRKGNVIPPVCCIIPAPVAAAIVPVYIRKCDADYAKQQDNRNYFFNRFYILSWKFLHNIKRFYLFFWKSHP